MIAVEQPHSRLPRRVLHIVPALFGADDGIFGGAERYALELARHMARQMPTTLLTFGDRERHETLDSLRIHVIGKPWYVRNQRSNPISLSLIGELRKADVVHCHQQHILASSLSALLCRLSGRSVFVSDLGGGGWDISAFVSTDRWFHGHLHISEYSRKVFGQLGKPWSYVVLGGVDTEKFSPDKTVKRDNTVLFVGRLLPHKGVDDLVNAVSPSMPLELIGQPSDARFVEDLKAMAHDKQVTFRHDCDDTMLVTAYRRALCVVLPSVYKTRYGEVSKVPELLGQTLLEAMACGTPVVCTNVASMPEVVIDGWTGFVVPANDPVALHGKLNWLRDHPYEAGKMGDAARQRVLQEFTWPKVVARCLKIYNA